MILDTNPTFSTRDRSTRAAWTAATSVNDKGETVSHNVHLTCTHDKDRKRFHAVARPVDTYRDNGFAVETFQMFNGRDVRLSSAPVARYSAKALDAFTAGALAELRSLSDTAAVAALFNGAPAIA